MLDTETKVIVLDLLGEVLASNCYSYRSCQTVTGIKDFYDAFYSSAAEKVLRHAWGYGIALEDLIDVANGILTKAAEEKEAAAQ